MGKKTKVLRRILKLQFIKVLKYFYLINVNVVKFKEKIIEKFLKSWNSQLGIGYLINAKYEKQKN